MEGGNLQNTIEQKNMEELPKTHARELEILNKIITSGNKAQDLQSFLEDVLSYTLELMNFEGGGIYLVDEITRTAEVVYHKNLPPDFVEDTKQVEIDVSPYDTIFIKGQPIITANYSEINPKRSKKWGLLSLVSVPLFAKDKIVGALNVASKTSHSFSDEEKDILQSIGREVGTVIIKMQMEEALRKSEERFRAIFETAQDSIFVKDHESRYILVNHAMGKLFGVPVSKLIGKTDNELFEAEAGAHHRETDFRVLNEETVRDESTKLVDGTLRTFHVIKVPMHDVNGKITGICGIARDITERKQMEAMLQCAEEDWRKSFNSLEDVMVIIDREYNIENINDAGLKLLGKSRGDVIGKKCYQIIDGADSIGEECLCKKSLKTKKVESFDRYEERSGKCFSIKSSPIFDEKGEIVRFVELMRDITDYKRIEKALRRSEKQFHDVALSSADWIWEVDKDARYTFASGKVEKILGYTSEELVGRTPFELMPEDEAKRVGEIFKTIASEKKPIVDLENWNLTKQGKKVCLLTNGVPLLDESGDLIGYRGVDKNITERRMAEEALEKVHKELERRVKDRTKKLAKAYDILQAEVNERKKMEEEIVKTKEYLQSIINSTSEIVVSIDMNNRISHWNKTAERITGYKQKEVSGRYVTKLEVFDNPAEILDHIKSVSDSHKPVFSEIVFRTKYGAKRIIQSCCSSIKNDKGQEVGFLYMGKDITHDVENHGKLLKGNSYLISDKNNGSALGLCAGLAESGCKCLFITRANPETIKSMIPSKSTEIVLMKQNKSGEFEHIQDLDGLTTKVKEFTERNANPVILLDRVDYLLTNFSFEQFAKTLYQINDITSENNAVLLLRLDSSLLDTKQMVFIENELQPLPSQKMGNVELSDELYDILRFIYKQNQKSAIVSVKNITKEFSVVDKTTTKRLRVLEDKGLIFIKKYGRTKTLRVSDKGKTLLHKRQVI